MADAACLNILEIFVYVEVYCLVLKNVRQGLRAYARYYTPDRQISKSVGVGILLLISR
jgi:hypothetical protein